MQPAKKSARREVDETKQNIIFGGCTVIVVALFALAYSFGTRRQANVGKQRSMSLHHAGEFIRKQLNECQNKSKMDADKAALLKGASAEVYRQNKQLEAENDRLVKLNEDLEKQNVACTENTELTRQQWVREDREHSEQLDTLDRRNKELREKAKRLHNTQGMRAILLLATLKKLGQENSNLRVANRLPPRRVTEDYVSELVLKWSGTQEFKTRKGEVLPPNRSEVWSDVAAKRRQAILEHFDPDRHAGKIFIPKKLPNGEWQIPSWHGRRGTQDVRHGTFIDSKLCPVTNINRQLRVLYEYALCAVGNNLTKFMYPTPFKRCSTCHTEYLHNYIETPLVLFCDDCRPTHSTNEFKLLCQGYSSEEQYGSELFWRVRSRLRFKGRFLNLAEDWLDANRFRGAGPTLAVRLPKKEQKRNCEKLRKSKRPILSYTKLLKGREGVQEYGDTFDSQCMPSPRVIFDHINARVKELGDDTKVYISSDMDEEEWQKLKSKIRVPIYRRLPTGRPTEDDIVDTYIAASCENTIINRYDIKSAHINEARMLLGGEKLSVAGTHVW
eukprot:TRINITY_DN36_c0_g1_i3.p1 TRINITY_DN36_c0_g1~~TRINITY_DN36_c0_g1_i3.p1  ORF type:complete len:557 (+),score=240.63 TRINITY_DN36_c0_g1_i3:143-1813(+)